MNSILETLRSTTDLGDASIGAPLHDLLSRSYDLEATKDYLYAILDAYAAGEDGARPDLYRRGILQALSIYLVYATECGATKRQTLTADDLLMLAMFFNELSTVTEVALFGGFCTAVSHFYALCTPLVLSGGCDARWDDDAVAALLTELQLLRAMLAKRLCSTMESLSKPSMFETTLECLRTMIRALWNCTPMMGDVTQSAWYKEVEGILNGLLRPLQQVLEDQVHASAHATEAVRRAAAQTTSPLLLTSVLGLMEDAVWMAQSDTKGHTHHTAALQHLLTELLSVLHKYLTLQQRSGTQQSGGHMAAGATDKFRLHSVQYAIRCTLSAALQAPESLLPASLRRGVSAAIAAFGGEAPVESPYAGEEILPQLTAVDSWFGEHARARPCRAVLAASQHVGDGRREEEDELVEEEAALLGGVLSGRDALLRTPMGFVSASALVDMVTLSLRALDLVDEGAIHQMHLEGLNQMQYRAARRAQAEEIDRLRRMEQQGVEAIPAGRLIEHVKESVAMQANGLQTLRRVSARAKLERAAFSSILKVYPCMKNEAEGTVRDTQALIARCLVQLPSSMADAALDELCLMLLKEFKKERNAVKKLAIASKTSSCYQLTIQVLFMYYASLAPIRDRGANPLLFLDDMTTDLAGPGSMLHTKSKFTIDTENPVAFLHDENVRQPCYATGRKRSRDDDDEYGEEDGDEAFIFFNDTVAAPCAYSHVLCRVLELAESCQLKGLLLDVLLQAPGLTRYVWYYLYRYFCLSKDKMRCIIGYWLLTNLSTRRPVYRGCAVNMLLHLCMSSNAYARRFAITQVGGLLSTEGTDGKPVVDAETEKLLVRYSKRQLVAIPGHQFRVFGTGRDDDEVTAELRAKEEKRAMDVLSRHLGLFLKLCVRQPRQLFSELLDVYKQCMDHNNELMVRLLPENLDVRRMTKLLLNSDPSTFVATVVPFLRRYSRDAAPFVQALLWALAEQLREMCQEAAAASNPSNAQEDYRKVAVALLGHAKAMFEASSIPLGGEDGTGTTVILHDIRFMAPFLSFVPATELKQKYLCAFLYFTQVQLQFQRRYQGTMPKLSMKERSIVLDPHDLHHLIGLVVREVLIKSAVQFDDDVARGLSPVDLFVYFHRATMQTSTTPSAAADSHGILDVPHSSAQAAGERLPPIGAVTTKEVLSVCLNLSRTFEDTTALRLYGPEEVQRAIKRLMQAPPVPPQLMATVLQAVSTFPRCRFNDFVRFVVQHVLTPLERASTWEVDPQLWRGAMLFTEKFYRECSGFLVNLPDQVLTQALREQPQLLEQFREEHGNNASFGHIIGNL